MRLNYDEVMQALADERHIEWTNVRADVLRRKVWNMMYSAPGCLPDHSEVCATKAQAIDTAVFLYGDDAPRGFKTRLQQHHIAGTDDCGFYRVEICRMTVGQLL
jgi:hypothetical protein